jgi:hypothetical protein
MRLSKGRVLPSVLVSLCFPAALLAAGSKRGPAKLTAKQIVERHLAARGGLQAWHGIQSMVWQGKLDVGFGDSVARSARYVSGAMARKGKRPRMPLPVEGKDDAQKQVQVPFVLEMKRPAKSRIEIEFAGKTAVQLYDGRNGWLMRPYLNHDDWEPFTAEQAKSQQDKWELDGPLIDYAAKGTKVELVSVEPVEGHDAYKLKLTTKSGTVQRIWIDARSFLDVKVQGVPRRMDCKMRSVWVYQRDFRSVQGLLIPFVVETMVEGFPQTHKIVLDKVAVNPKLDAATFAKPKA